MDKSGLKPKIASTLATFLLFSLAGGAAFTTPANADTTTLYDSDHICQGWLPEGTAHVRVNFQFGSSSDKRCDKLVFQRNGVTYKLTNDAGQCNNSDLADLCAQPTTVLDEDTSENTSICIKDTVSFPTANSLVVSSSCLLD